MLALEGLSVTGDAGPIVADLSLTVGAGEIVALIGPSGCGKSTVLRWLAGILPPALPARGRLTLDSAPATAPDPRIGYQPQTDALLPWLTATRNAALGLEMRGLPRREARARAEAMLPAFGLAGQGGRFPDELSGGMRQRIAFLRALLPGPQWLLLDEPFSALDAVTRLGMQDWLARTLAQGGCGVLLVTHDLHEATTLADRILVMAPHPGRIRAEIAVPIPRAGRDEAALAPLRTRLKTLLLEEAAC